MPGVRKRDECVEYSGLLEQWNYSAWWIHSESKILYTAHTHRMYNTKREPQYKLWALGIMTCQHRFINGNKCTILESKVDNGRSSACVGMGSIWEISVTSSQFCHKSKTTPKQIKCRLKIKVKISVANITFSTSALVFHIYLFSEKVPLAINPNLQRYSALHTLCSFQYCSAPRKQLTLVYDISWPSPKTGGKLNRNNRWRRQVVTKKINNLCRKIPERE